jgi:hypothetical protein
LEALVSVDGQGQSAVQIQSYEAQEFAFTAMVRW